MRTPIVKGPYLKGPKGQNMAGDFAFCKINMMVGD